MIYDMLSNCELFMALKKILLFHTKIMQREKTSQMHILTI